MAAATATQTTESSEELIRTRQVEKPKRVTLLELVEAVSASAENEREVVETILSLLRNGRVKLCGNFRDDPIESFED
jgi:hypothetical protein